MTKERELNLVYEVLITGMIPFTIDGDGATTGRWQIVKSQVLKLEVKEEDD